MAAKVSAGLLMYRYRDGAVQVFLAHPGGPYFRHKNDGHWTIPKGVQHPGEPLLETAIREFGEEVGLKPSGHFIELASIRQKGGKTVYAWAFEGDWDASWQLRSTEFELEWPPDSGQKRMFPEVDRASFFNLDEARLKMKESQWPLVERLLGALGSKPGPG